MKKILTILMAVIVAICPIATAFADDGTTTLTVEIPENAASYTFNCPATVDLEYGRTSPQFVGVLQISNAPNIMEMEIRVRYTDLTNVEDSSDTLGLIMSFENYGEYPIDKETGLVTGSTQKNIAYVYEDGKGVKELYATIPDFTHATPGATYKSVCTYSLEVLFTK